MRRWVVLASAVAACLSAAAIYGWLYPIFYWCYLRGGRGDKCLYDFYGDFCSGEHEWSEETKECHRLLGDVGTIFVTIAEPIAMLLALFILAPILLVVGLVGGAISWAFG